MSLNNELQAYVFLKAKIKAVLTGNEQFIDNPDEEFDLVTSSNTSAPAVVLQLDTTIPTTTAMTGRIISGDTIFAMAIYVDKLNRPYLTYKAEKITLVNKILDAFNTSGERVLFNGTKFGDFELGGINASAAVVEIAMPIGNYSYEVTE